VNLFDASGNRITGISFGASTTYRTFDNTTGLGSSTLPLPTVSTLSTVGVNGAFLSANPAPGVTTRETGSPSAIFTVINGTSGRDTINGTVGRDRIIGGLGGDTLTGDAGADEFVYTNIRDAGDRITDFVVGSDKIVLTQLLDSLIPSGYNGTNAIADGYVQVIGQGSNAIVQLDQDGFGSAATFRTFITVDNVGVTLNNPSNFVF
jgi:hypothetical protein